MSIQFLDPSADVRTQGSSITYVAIHIVNKTGKQLEIAKIDSQGLEEAKHYLGNLYHTISVRMDEPNNTAWVIKTLDGVPLFKFVSSHRGQITITEEGPKYSAIDEKHLNDEIFGSWFFFTPSKDEVLDGEWSTHWGYGVPDAAKALDVTAEFTPLIETKLNNHGILNMLGFTEAWAAGYTGKGVKVAVLDSGLIDHPEISVSDRWNTFTENQDVQATDNLTHGLKVAAPIVAAYDANKYGAGKPVVTDITGGSPDVELLDIRITESNGGAPGDNIIKGIHKAVEMGAKVIQISFINPDSEADPKLIKAVQHAYDNNVLVVWAAGNYGSPTPTGMALTSLNNISVSVGNFNYATIEPFQTSNLAGPTKHSFFFAPSNGHYPDKNDSYQLHIDGGTSFSAPYVTAMAALLYQKYPQATVSEIIEKLKGSAWQPSIGQDAEINSENIVVLHLDDLSTSVENGTPLTDLLVVNSNSSEFSINRQENNLILNHAQQSFDISQVERVKFTDKSLAFDTDGKAGDALQLISALTGSVYLNDKSVIGQVIHMLDTADHRNDVAATAVDMVLGTGWSSDQLMTLLLRNVYQSDPTTAMTALVSTLKTGMGMSDFDIIWMAAESDSNNYIDLVGVASSGIEYMPFGV
ncbi:MAG: S8/S53 family peptidase [Pseudomonadota bacterium]|nr:S8/S53 family peptidase [Pseudomonadota bacterium]